MDGKHAPNCIRSEGEWICGGGCRADEIARECQRLRNAKAEGLELAADYVKLMSPMARSAQDTLREWAEAARRGEEPWSQREPERR